MISPETRLTMLLISRRVGAKFYLQRMQSGDFDVSDSFYIASQKNRHGNTVLTMYTISYEKSGLNTEFYQSITSMLCSANANWLDTARIPLPCYRAFELARFFDDNLRC